MKAVHRRGSDLPDLRPSIPATLLIPRPFQGIAQNG